MENHFLKHTDQQQQQKSIQNLLMPIGAFLPIFHLSSDYPNLQSDPDCNQNKDTVKQTLHPHRWRLISISKSSSTKWGSENHLVGSSLLCLLL